MRVNVVAADVRSPCVDVCRIDPQNGLCLGCFRTIEEIVAWPSASRDAKLAVLAAIEERRAGSAPRGADSSGNCDR